MEKQRPIVAFLYDFDKTLCTTDMQNYAFIPSLGMTPAEFWAVANGFGRANRIDGILAYMYTMIAESEKKSIPFTREELASFLCVNRSALSHEIALMKQEGIIQCRKNSFTLLHWENPDAHLY